LSLRKAISRLESRSHRRGEAMESVLEDGTVKVTHNFRQTLFRRYERQMLFDTRI
jgi:hypothetical protein